MMKSDIEIVKEFLNHQGDLPDELVLDPKASYKMAELVSEFLAKRTPGFKLSEAQILNIAQFMWRSHPITRMRMWSGLNNHIPALYAVDRMWLATHSAWKRFEMPADDEKEILQKLLTIPPQELEPWLKEIGIKE